MATTQALAVFVQNEPACTECRFWRNYVCPDSWFHENTGICHGCDAARDISAEHDMECPMRDNRMLAQASSMLRGTLRGVMIGDAPPIESEYASSFEDDSDGHSDSPPSFDEDQIVRDHFQICEECSPFSPTSCNGSRMCRDMALYNHALTCQRMVYVRKDMPRSKPRDCPLQERIVALAVLMVNERGI